MHKLITLKEFRDYQSIALQMNEIYGEQAHIPTHVMNVLAETYPELFQVILKNGEMLGHLVILPFNQRGMEKITDLENDESNFELSDFALIKSVDTPVYFFVYTIYGKNQRISFHMIREMCEAMKKYSTEVSSDSFIFAECVSEEGIRMSEKLGMRLYHTYTFRDEELFLYKASVKDFVKTSFSHSSLDQKKSLILPSFAEPSYQ